MWLKEMFVFFLSLALGYALCVIAKKQVSILKTLGYTLGIAIMILTFAAGLVMSQSCAHMKSMKGMKGKGCSVCGMHGMSMMKHHK